MSEVLKLSKVTTHQIYRDLAGNILPGGSTISKIGIDSGGLIYWAWKKGAEGKDFRKALDEEADIGTVGHFLIQCYLTGVTPDVSDFSSKCISAAEKVLKVFVTFWERESLVLVGTELQMVHEKLGFGGTLDIISRNQDGDSVLIDLKSSKAIYPAHLYQLSGYEELWNFNNPDDRIVQRGILRINKHKVKDTETRWQGCMEAHLNVFKKQLDLFNALKKVSD